MIQLLDVGLQHSLMERFGVEFCGVEDGGRVLLAKVDRSAGMNISSKEKVDAAKEVLLTLGINVEQIKYRTVEKKVGNLQVGVQQSKVSDVYLISPSVCIDAMSVCHISHGEQEAYKFAKNDIKRAIKEKKWHIRSTDRYLIIKLKEISRKDLAWLKQHETEEKWCVWQYGEAGQLLDFVKEKMAGMKELYIVDVMKK